ncbi:hypothetical protein PMAYCL1PPCAC_21846, partial [Pristionchus mayeri]
EDLVHRGYDCYLWRAPPCFTLYGTMFSLIIISLERIIATVQYKTYEQSPKWLGFLLGFVEILIPLACTGVATYYYDFEVRFLYCSIVSQSNFSIFV